MATLRKQNGSPAQTMEPVDLGEHGSITVAVRRPDFDAIGMDHALTMQGYADSNPASGDAASDEHRIKTCIVGWAGVNDESGAPVEFTWPSVVALCEQIPSLYFRLLGLANVAFRGLPGDAKKNSAPPPSEPIAAEAQATTIQF